MAFRLNDEDYIISDYIRTVDLDLDVNVLELLLQQMTRLRLYLRFNHNCFCVDRLPSVRSIDVLMRAVIHIRCTRDLPSAYRLRLLCKRYNRLVIRFKSAFESCDTFSGLTF